MTESRRLLVVLPEIFRLGGIQRFNRLLCRAVDELAPTLGLEATVVSQNDTRDDYLRHGSPWRNLRFEPGGGKRRTALRVLSFCYRGRPDMLLIGHLRMAVLGPPCSPFTRRGFAFVAHGTEAWSVPRWSWRLAARRARYAFVVSQYTGRLLCRETGLDPSRTRHFPNALDPGLDQDAPAPPSSADLELLSVARLDATEREKGIDHTLRALPSLLPRYPGMRYRIVGGGSDKPRLVELSERLGLSGHVEFEEGLSDEELTERYRRCSLFVLPSGQEGFGIVFLEAMRFGKACIGGSAGGTPEVIEDGETGLLVPFGDLETLRNALDRLIGDAELRRSMGLRGRERVRRLFAYERYRDRVEAYLREWLGA